MAQVRENRTRTTTRRPGGASRPDPRTRQAVAAGYPSPKRASSARLLTVVSALLILAGGYVHFCLYRHGYRFIPKIGVSFLLQSVSSAILAGALLFRRRRIRLGRHFVPLAQMTRLSAIGLSVGTLAGLGIAHTPGGLFQFHELGLRPRPQTLIAIVVESLAALLLTVAMVAARTAARSQPARERSYHQMAAPVRDAA
jgi:hypothetical protein